MKGVAVRAVLVLQPLILEAYGAITLKHRWAGFLSSDRAEVSESIALRVHGSSHRDFSSAQAEALAKVDIDDHALDAAVHAEAGGNVQLQFVAGEGGRSLSVKTAPARVEGSFVAKAKYDNTMATTGWAHLSVVATDSELVAPELRMYAAGFLEGLASAKQIHDFQHNADILLQQEEEKHHALANIRTLFGRELDAMVNRCNLTGAAAFEKPATHLSSWDLQVRYALLQSWGMLDAFNQRAKSAGWDSMSMVDFMILNSDGETPELMTAYDMEENLLRMSQSEDANGTDSSGDVLLQQGSHRESERRSGHSPAALARQRRSARMQGLNDAAWRRIKLKSGRCSALVRLAEHNQDLFVGHATFSDYSEMTRIFKFYDLPLGDGVVRRMGFSSYPGVAGSTDDYYVLDSGLVVTETTISMLTDEPYDKLQSDPAVEIPDFMRIMVANRLAQTGSDWADLMRKSSTGTYSSQWMVVDYNRFTAGAPLEAGALWVVEQAPGITHAEDMTQRLQQLGYWASENRAWYKDVRGVVGATDAEDLHGALFSADHNPRANIFAATAPKVQTVADMRDELTRNRWPHEVDGGPANTPDHAIAARGDLATSDPDPNGAVDAKVAGSCLVRRLQCNAISGPTHNGQTPFRWTDKNGHERFEGVPHQGMPDVWNFDWVRMTSDGEETDLADECNV
mmetsp:Transcript_15841/g.28893  ORF Transcript_15841/g.28893 Transcript_15841/m.28893 type:complete len:682 (+) Transcript_15841:71-2116(+)